MKHIFKYLRSLRENYLKNDHFDVFQFLNTFSIKTKDCNQISFFSSFLSFESIESRILSLFHILTCSISWNATSCLVFASSKRLGNRMVKSWRESTVACWSRSSRSRALCISLAICVLFKKKSNASYEEATLRITFYKWRQNKQRE